MKDTKLALFIAAILIMLAAATREEPAASESLAKTQVVPLVFAEALGADQWPPSMKERFLNDPENQIRMSQPDRIVRDGRGPDEWLPSSGQCDYMGRFMAVMERYQLHHREPQWRGWQTKRQRCYTQFQ